MHVIKSVDLVVLFCFTIKTTNSQGNFSDRIVTFVCCCVNDIILTPFQILGQFSTKIGKKHHFIKGVRVCSEEGSEHHQRGCTFFFSLF